MEDISFSRIQNFRRDLHRIPELDRDLPQTQAYIISKLKALRCRVFTPIEGSVCAYFDFKQPKTAAFRTDMDALPVGENTGLPFASQCPGRMHACGHDGHMAMVLELAHIVNSCDRLPFNILLIFQPAEETTGGAKDIVASGVFEKYSVAHIFGVHLWPGLPVGQAATKAGDMLARSSEVTVSITGKSSHIARASEGKDALLAGVEFISRAYDMVENEVPYGVNRLLKFGKMTSGTARNALSAYTEILGSLRSFSPETFDFMKSRLYEIAGDISAQTGCVFDINVNEGYPAVINHEGLYKAVSGYLGPQISVLTEPYMIAEDFSYYGLAVPSLFFLLGAGTDEPLHSDRFSFDEKALISGVELYKKLLFFPGL